MVEQDEKVVCHVEKSPAVQSATVSQEDNILELRQLKKTFTVGLFRRQKQQAVNSVSCRFPKGFCTGLLGHNGAGKTTIIKMILGLIEPERGEILFCGKPISRVDRALIGYLPEAHRFSNNLTCEEVLRFHLNFLSLPHRSVGFPKERTRELLKLVGLWEHRRKKVTELSKGMARRLAWAQAISHKPEFLILDEPFSGLDPVGRREMRDWILDLKARKISVLLCTHEMKTVEDLCDEIHILNSGRLVFSTLSPYLGQSEEEINVSKDPHLYSVCISGASFDTANELLKNFLLPSWHSCSQDGFLLSLNFRDYTDAARWLLVFLNKGFVVIRFGKAHNLTEERLLKFFVGGGSC